MKHVLILCLVLESIALAQPAGARVRCRTNAYACEGPAEPFDGRAAEARCWRGDSDACVELALAHMGGTGVAYDLVRARRWSAHACSLEHGGACGVAASLFRYGHGGPSSNDAARDFYERGCEAGDGTSCYQVGEIFRVGRGVAWSFETAGNWFERACAAGYGEGCRLQLMMLFTKDPPSRHRQRALFDAGCLRGDDESCAALVAMFANDYPREKANRDVFVRLDRDCWARQPTCARAGALREGSPGVPESFSLAESLYRQGCWIGEADSCRALARLITLGLARGDARETLAEACARGVAAVCSPPR